MSIKKTLQGVVDRIVYRSEENGYTVAYINYSDPGTPYEEIAAVGYFPSVEEGELLKIIGEFVYNSVYGRQFKVKNHYKIIPTDALRATKLLSGGLFKGVGPYTAGKIVEKFGDRTMDVIESRSVKILDVPGVGPATANLIWESLDSYAGKLDIIKWMVDYGFSNQMIQRITTWFKDTSITKLRSNPYQLTYIKGVGFNKADAFARWTGIKEDDPERIRAGILHILMNDDNGHTFLPTSKLKPMVCGLLNVDLTLDQFSNEVFELETRKRVVVKNWGVHAIDLYYSEEYISKSLIELSGQRTLKDKKQEDQLSRIIDDYEKVNGLNLNEMQRHAVLRAAVEGISILTGAPGTGKTLTIGAIINYYRVRGASFMLCAPTGRAAKRMTESIGQDAATIHRMLGFNQEELWKFLHNEKNKLDTDLIIVDEISMVDVKLMRSLLEAVDRERTSVVLVGDENQLPSIGPGNVLKDCIASDKIAFTRLTELYRQAKQSIIVQNAHAVNKGVKDIERGGRGKDFIWHNSVTPRMVTKVISEFIPEQYGIKPEDTIVLSPIRRAAGDLNVNNINTMLQGALNDAGRPIPSSKADIRLGDPVVHNENDYTKEVFNGDIGTVTTIHPQSVMDKGMFFVDYYGREVMYEITQINQIELARAISIHRSQGGEYDAVVIVLPDTYVARKLLSRNLLYTAITRSRKLCILLGKESIVHRAIANDVVAKRNTRLKQMLGIEFRKLKRKK